MLDYFINVLLFQTLFLVTYDVILKRETFFQWNRGYLILTSVLAYVIPFIKLPQMAKVVPQEYVILLPEIMLSPQSVIKEQDWSTLLFITFKWLLFIGVGLALLSFIFRLAKLMLLIKNNEKEHIATYKLVYLKAASAFSFFNYIFLGKETSIESKAQIIKHELVHVKQRHSLDLLFFELQKIICWFNPYSYIYQNRISELHEFIADSKSVKESDKSTYFQNLLAETFGTHKISFINPFLNHSLIKKRIVMLNKAKSKQLLKFKYLLMLPLLLGMLLYSSCEKEEEQEIMEKELSELETIYESDPTAYDFLTEIKKKGDELELTTEQIQSLLDIVQNSVKNSHDPERQKKIKEALILYLLEKRGTPLGYNDIVEVEEIPNSGGVTLEDVPFASIDKAPIFPGCEGSSDLKDCLNKNLSKFVAQNFNMNIAKSQNLKPGKKRIYVQFKITKEGGVDIKGIRAPHPELEGEAKRVVELLPQMKPGEQNGKPVNVTYMLPISFKIEE